jgi:hypothetical protein
MLHDVLPSVQAGLEDFGAADGAVVFEGAVQAGKHLVGLAVADLIDPLQGEQCRDDFWAIGLFPSPQDIFAEIEIALVPGQPVEQDHGFEHAGGRQAHVPASLDNIAFARSIAEAVA